MENEHETAEETGANEGELDGMKLEHENLKSEVVVLKQELKTRDEKLFNLEKSLAEKSGALSVAGKALEEAKQVIVETSVDLSQSITAYRELAGQANPGLIAEMIQGNSITEINASVKHARELVEKVRREIEAGNARVRVPAGAPPRAMTDTGILSAREKIKLAVEGK
jgi:hypothetical protein